MRTTKLFTCVVAALSLMYASGCCEQNSIQNPGVNCQPVTYNTPCGPVTYAAPVAVAPTVTYEPTPAVAPQPLAVNCQQVVNCPPPKPPKPRKVKKQRRARYNCYNRNTVNCYAPAPGTPCAQYYPTVAYAGTATLLTNPEYVPAVNAGTPQVAATAPVVAVAPVKKGEVAGNCVTVYQRGRKGRKVQGKRRAQVAAAPVAYVQPAASTTYTVDPVPYVEPVTSEPYAITPLSPAPAAAEPATSEEPTVYAAEPVVQEPSYAKYLAPETTSYAAEAIETGPLDLTAGQVFESPRVFDIPQTLDAQVQQPYMQPVVIQPIIQPVLQPAAQMPAPMPGITQVQGQVATPMIVAPSANSWVEGGMVSSAYCPPEICPPSASSVCGPGEGCFTLSDNQLLNSPYIHTPDVVSALPQGFGSVDSGTAGLAVPVASPVYSAAPVTAPVVVAPVMTAPVQNGVQSKYEALPPPQDMRRPQVTLPAPLGNDNIPVVPGANEIESMLDAMVPPPNLK